MIEWALQFALAAVSLALALTSWRLVRGPEPVDRVLALDTLYVNTVGLVILLGLKMSSNLLFEAALVIAMLGFIATIALARFIARGDVME
jgi:multicomponent K+:H+ antiporter subunit F